MVPVHGFLWQIKRPLPYHPVSFGIEESAQIDKQLGTGNEPKMESQKKIFADWRNTPRVTYFEQFLSLLRRRRRKVKTDEIVTDQMS